MEESIKMGISACLLGESVRYDGGHKLDRFLKDTLGKWVEYVPVCPEVEYGLSIPREALHLAGDVQSPRLVTVRSGVDHTDGMLGWARKRVAELEKEELCGFIFKAKSPSSGMERVLVYPRSGIPVKKGVGLFAGVFMKHFPLLPVEDEGRLHDPGLRENFIERVFAMKRWRELLKREKRTHHLIEFHTRHKLLIRAHSEKHYRLLGKLVAEAAAISPEDAYSQYIFHFSEALKLKATAAKHTNVLQHMMGYFKNVLSPDEKQELLEIIDGYRKGHFPLIVPVTLINHYVRKPGERYRQQQVSLNPHPIELQLRNHV
jgi:uncharacterized protein YbgA (DUF1722 family)/uncharacterized protein YbbK (DUF523 family)